MIMHILSTITKLLYHSVIMILFTTRIVRLQFATFDSPRYFLISSHLLCMVMVCSEIYGSIVVDNITLYGLVQNVDQSTMRIIM